eukprot:3773395-Amphidinium_carterae.1
MFTFGSCLFISSWNENSSQLYLYGKYFSLFRCTLLSGHALCRAGDLLDTGQVISWQETVFTL